MNTKYRIIAITIIAIIVIISCAAYYSQITKPTELRISIASSLIHVTEDMATQFEKENNVKIILNSDSSSTLYTQITSGAPADVFMSADQKWTNQLLTNNPGLLNNIYENFTTNSLQIILAPNNPANITSIADLAKPNVKLVLAAPSVPAGSYANSTIWKIDSTWGNPNSPQYINSGAYKNFNASVYQNVVSYENSVEQVVGKVSLDVGTADAGIVFVSDGVYGISTGASVTFIEIPAEVNTKGIYGIGVIGSTQQPELAQKFMNYWLSKTGEELLTKYGFNS
ncbi:MAG: molybdate ABC transporter substrate-binding protein [Candidatus Bathyarchaeota archaeon]|nr:molybdate ABC transporter substrate-binding protein [Candidatus Termiticorpusculum sp.]